MFARFMRWLLSLFGIKTNAPTPTTTSTEGNTMAQARKPVKKALLVGINKYQVPNADLNGCVNDVEGVWDILTKKYSFHPDNIRVLTDERATREGIVTRLDWLLEGAQAGDELLFHYSGHGSQCRDRDGDELDDSLDELICPTDLSWDNPLTDDDLYILFRELPQSVYLTVVMDACHSGTMTRGIAGNPKETLAKFIAPPFDIAARSRGRNIPVRRIAAKKGVRGADTQRHVLLSGCRDDQTSADANFNGRWGGALTTTLLQVLEEHPDWDWNHIHEEVTKKVREGGFSQEPQLSVMLELRERVPFGGAA
jgi:hypothetical protein